MVDTLITVIKSKQIFSVENIIEEIPVTSRVRSVFRGKSLLHLSREGLVDGLKSY